MARHKSESSNVFILQPLRLRINQITHAFASLDGPIPHHFRIRIFIFLQLCLQLVVYIVEGILIILKNQLECNPLTGVCRNVTQKFNILKLFFRLQINQSSGIVIRQILAVTLDSCPEGIEKVLWIPRGVYMDEDTNGHVDNMCNYVRPGEVVLAWCDDENDPQYERSVEALNYLESQTDAKGRKLKIHKLSCPSPLLITEEESGGVDSVEGTLPRNVGDRMAGSYVNYYTGNGFIALPVFGDPNDEKAVKLLQELYPDRKIETVYAREILLGGGNIHCITQQVPAGK